MHLVVGERVYSQIPQLKPTPPVYGAFLLGCVLVDVHIVSSLDRPQTHFVGRLEEDGESAFRTSCASFLSQVNVLLLRRWSSLSRCGQAFVAGYLCHLATDESWKEYNWCLLQELGITSVSALPVPNEVLLTAYQVLSAKAFVDASRVASALKEVVIPDVLAHLPHEALVRMWKTIQPLALDGSSPESYFQMARRAGESEAVVQAIREEHDSHWDDTISFIQVRGGVEPQIQRAVARSVDAVPKLWAKGSAPLTFPLST